MTTIAIGSKAPEFKGLNQNNEEVTLQQYKGKKVILYFYPRDNTPGCTAESKNLNENFDLLTQKGFVIIGVSPDSIKSHCSFAEKFGFRFNLIADTEKTILQAYNAWGKKSMYGKEYMGVLRTTYVINEDGIISAIFTKVNTKEHTQQILAELES